jgi:hypothetical protein
MPDVGFAVCATRTARWKCKSQPEQPTNVAQIKRTVKLVTRQRPIAEPSPMEGFPMRSWSIEIFLVDDKGNDIQASCFEKAVYNLHPSFEKNKQSMCMRAGRGEQGTS